MLYRPHTDHVTNHILCNIENAVVVVGVVVVVAVVVVVVAVAVAVAVVVVVVVAVVVVAVAVAVAVTVAVAVVVVVVVAATATAAAAAVVVVAVAFVAVAVVAVAVADVVAVAVAAVAAVVAVFRVCFFYEKSVFFLLCFRRTLITLLTRMDVLLVLVNSTITTRTRNLPCRCHRSKKPSSVFLFQKKKLSEEFGVLCISSV